MKPGERLKDIEDNFDNMSFFDKDWLISRVKKLTEALEFYRDGHWNGDLANGETFLTEKNLTWHQGDIARKALEEE